MNNIASITTRTQNDADETKERKEDAFEIWTLKERSPSFICLSVRLERDHHHHLYVHTVSIIQRDRVVNFCCLPSERIDSIVLNTMSALKKRGDRRKDKRRSRKNAGTPSRRRPGRHETPKTYRVHVGSRVKTISKRSPYDAKLLTSTNYMSRRLRSNDAAYYSAAGVLPYRVLTDETGAKRIEVLLGVEDQYDKVKKVCLSNKINLLGGKREKGDMCAENTAVRELWEETGALLSPAVTSRMASGKDLESCFWYRSGKYALYFHRCSDTSELNDLPTRYASLPAKRLEEMAEMTCLLWIPVRVEKTRAFLELSKDALDSFTLSFLVKAICNAREVATYLRRCVLKDDDGSLSIVEKINTLNLQDERKGSGDDRTNATRER